MTERSDQQQQLDMAVHTYFRRHHDDRELAGVTIVEATQAPECGWSTRTPRAGTKPRYHLVDRVVLAHLDDGDTASPGVRYRCGLVATTGLRLGNHTEANDDGRQPCPRCDAIGERSRDAEAESLRNVLDTCTFPRRDVSRIAVIGNDTELRTNIGQRVVAHGDTIVEGIVYLDTVDGVLMCPGGWATVALAARALDLDLPVAALGDHHPLATKYLLPAFAVYLLHVDNLDRWLDARRTVTP